MNDPLQSPRDYALFIHTLSEHFVSMEGSTLVYIPHGARVGKVAGMIHFPNHIVLCVLEILNFELQVIESYSYEVSRHLQPLAELPDATEYCRAGYPHKKKLYWYDSFPHPNDPTLASTHPHHKHIHPDIKNHRIPATDLTFTAPNLPFLIREIEQSNLNA